jgi:murein DD-endopeptidase MepM/ murein hydrolase activator NlpD
LRPDIPQKIAGAALSNGNEDRSPLVDARAFVTSEMSRYGCNAAMLSVALSIGACGSIILPSLQSVAQATEPAVVQTSNVEPSNVPASNVEAVNVETAGAASGISPEQPAVVAAPTVSAVATVPAVTPSVTSSANAQNTQPTAVETVSENAHTVQTGESLWRISKIHGLNIEALAQLNQLQPNAALKVGQVLRLPVVSNSNLNGRAKDGVTNLQAIAQAVPEIPVVASNTTGTMTATPGDAFKSQQNNAVDASRQQRAQLQQGLAEFGEGTTTGSVPATMGASSAPSALTQPSIGSALPVTTIAQTPMPAIGGEAPSPVTANGAVANAATVVALKATEPSARNFNASNLLSEIKGIRDRYQRQLSPYQAVANAQPAIDTVIPTVSSPVPARVEAMKANMAAVNPDFSSRKNDSSLSIELRNFVQPKLKPEDGSLKAVATSPATSPTQHSPAQQGQVIARSTIGADVYAPVAPSVKRMVAPNLPPIGREDAYLPGGMNIASGQLIWPAQGVLSSGFGMRWGRPHRGIDIAGPVGTPIVSAAPGKVSYAQWNDGGYGYMVEVEHPDGTMTRYAHNNRLLVREGQAVAQGEQLSEMGSTGHSTGPHLHFEVHPRGQGAVNPMAFLNSQS